MKESNGKQHNNRYFKLGLSLFFSAAGAILFYYLLFHGSDLKSTILNTIAIFTPILLGITLAYLLNPLMNFFERNIVWNIWNRIKNTNKEYPKEKKCVRAISVLLTMIAFGFILYGLIMLIVPQVIESIQNIIFRIPLYMDNLNKWFDDFLEKNPGFKDLSDTYWIDIEQWLTSSFVPKLQDLISNTSTSLLGGVMSVFNGLLNFIIGIIISVYLLFSKELFCAQAKKITYALLREERANNLINNMRYSDKIFGGFISGKILDSCIIGILCYICMLLLKLPYPALISVIVGVTNIIPYFGPFIGAIPSALILFMISPMKCLTFCIFILILQQFDGNILGPKILGDSTGLNSFWVIFSITMFSGFFGIFGMFIGVPLFAVIYAAIRTFINQRLEKKNLPTSTDYYKSNDYHSEADDVPNAGRDFKFVKKTFENVFPERRHHKEESSSDEILSDD